MWAHGCAHAVVMCAHTALKCACTRSSEVCIRNSEVCTQCSEGCAHRGGQEQRHKKKRLGLLRGKNAKMGRLPFDRMDHVRSAFPIRQPPPVQGLAWTILRVLGSSVLARVEGLCSV